MSTGTARSRVWPFLAAAAVYSAATIALTSPLAWRLSTDVPGDQRDPLLNAWILWWNAHTLPLAAGWWSPPAFYPVPGVLALSEHLLGLTPLTSPIQWLGGSPVLAYNVIFLLSFPLAALAAYGLGLSLTGRADAAFLTGLAFAFSPYRIAQMAHLQMLASFWMPIALIGLHGFAREGRRRSIALFVGAWLMQGLSDNYYLLFFPVLAGLWLIWFLPPWRDWRRLARVMVFWCAGGLLLLPLASGYYDVHGRLGLRQSIAEIAASGAHLSSVLQMSPLLRFWRSPTTVQTEQQLFPGVTLVLLVAAGVVSAVRNRRAEVNRSVFWFYICAAGVMWLLSLGPAPTLQGVTLWSHSPYTWLLALPGFEAVRVPARFTALMLLCLSTAAGLAWADLAPTTGGKRLGVACAIALCLLADTWIRATPTFAVPQPIDVMTNAPAPAAVLELPLGDEAADAAAVYRTTSYGRPVVNGYSGYFPPHYAALTAALREHEDAALTLLATYGPIVIVVDGDADVDRSLASYLDQHAGIGRLEPIGRHSRYWLAATERQPVSLHGAALPIERVTASVGGDPLPAVTDGRASSAWRSGRSQQGTEEVVADLGVVRDIAAAELWLGSEPRNFPRTLRIAVSEDGQRWDEVWQGHGSVPALVAGFENPIDMPARYDFASRPARFVRFRQVGRDRRPWAIAELRLLAPR